MRSFLFTKMMALDATFKKIISRGCIGGENDTQEIDIKVMKNVEDFHRFINFVLGRLKQCDVSESDCQNCLLSSQLHMLKHSYAQAEKFARHDIRILYSGGFKACTKYSIVIMTANTEDVVYNLKIDIAT